MPEISRFYGLVIKIFYDDHNPPHFHAEYGEYEVLINVTTLAIMSGRLPARALGMVTEWAALHQGELRIAWERAKQLLPPGQIEPLP
ncbi:MAG TPA: DUF4160 domain-containing protein [Candidatus Acidoferrum sp.]|nr:DUF4160 domain-containing protein [Candidatus Acidoferrum sp.]